MPLTFRFSSLMGRPVSSSSVNVSRAKYTILSLLQFPLITVVLSFSFVLPHLFYPPSRPWAGGVASCSPTASWGAGIEVAADGADSGKVGLLKTTFAVGDYEGRAAESLPERGRNNLVKPFNLYNFIRAVNTHQQVVLRHHSVLQTQSVYNALFMPLSFTTLSCKSPRAPLKARLHRHAV